MQRNSSLNRNTMDDSFNLRNPRTTEPPWCSILAFRPCALSASKHKPEDMLLTPMAELVVLIVDGSWLSWLTSKKFLNGWEETVRGDGKHRVIKHNYVLQWYSSTCAGCIITDTGASFRYKGANHVEQIRCSLKTVIYQPAGFFVIFRPWHIRIYSAVRLHLSTNYHINWNQIVNCFGHKNNIKTHFWLPFCFSHNWIPNLVYK